MPEHGKPIRKRKRHRTQNRSDEAGPSSGPARKRRIEKTTTTGRPERSGTGPKHHKKHDKNDSPFRTDRQLRRFGLSSAPAPRAAGSDRHTGRRPRTGRAGRLPVRPNRAPGSEPRIRDRHRILCGQAHDRAVDRHRNRQHRHRRQRARRAREHRPEDPHGKRGENPAHAGPAGDLRRDPARAAAGRPDSLAHIGRAGRPAELLRGKRSGLRPGNGTGVRRTYRLELAARHPLFRPLLGLSRRIPSRA